MSSNSQRIFVVLILCASLPLACSLFVPAAAPTDQAEVLLTSVAINVVSQLTQTAAQSTASWQTEQAQLPNPTATQPAVNLTPTGDGLQAPTAAPPAEPTLLPPTSPPAVPCNRAMLLGESTTPPGPSLPSSAPFTKTWQLKNNGACTWTIDYALTFTGGDPMGPVTVVVLPRAVPPGEDIELSLALTTPPFPGYYESDWTLRDESGTSFGSGELGLAPFVVQVYAVQTGTVGTFQGDFFASACAAVWQSASGALTCPGPATTQPGGAVALLQTSASEARRGVENALLTRPNLGGASWISGYYPAYTIGFNDHFLTDIGCLDNSPGCDVYFQLDYQTLSGVTFTLGRWREVYDGRLTPLDISFSDMLGEQVRFILTVTNNGDPANAAAVWLSPRMVRQTPNTLLVLDWTRRGGTSICNRLRINLTNFGNAEARAYRCSGAEVELGRLALSGSDLDQLMNWFWSFHNFDAEVIRAQEAIDIRSSIGFQGQGQDDATDEDINAINEYAARIYNLIGPE
jgi:hypothetical protein